MKVRLDIKVYSPTTYRGLRYRVKFNDVPMYENKFQAFDYKYNNVLDMVLDTLNYSDEQVDKIINTKDGYVVFATRW